MQPSPRPKGIFITADELNATRGLSDLAVRLYWRMRTLMDISTGIVGQSRRISYQSLKEDCEVLTPKGLGHQRTQPTLRNLRTALDGLERAGLAEPLGLLVFRLALAQKLQARPNQTRHEPGTVENVASPCQQGDSARTRQAESAEPGIPKGFKEKHSYFVAAASRAPEPVDSSAGGVAADFLNLLSKRLGYPIVHRHGDPVLARWAAEGVTPDRLESAVLAAQAARQRDGNPAPLNPGFIAAFLAQPEDWRTTWSGIVGKGKEHGIEQQPGEPAPNFKARVFLAASTSEVAA